MTWHHSVEDDAIRDLSRVREATMRTLKAARCRRQACLLRQDIRDTGQATWGPAHLRGRSAVVWPTPTQPMVFQAYVRAINEPTARLGRLDPALHDQANPGV